MSIAGWLRRRFGAASAAMPELWLDLADALEFPPPESLRALILATCEMPSGSVLCLEGGRYTHTPALRAFLTRHEYPNPAIVRRQTIWPKQPLHHVLIERNRVEQLAAFADGVSPDALCYHLVVYRERDVLLWAHDTPSDPFLVNKHLPQQVIESFADRLGVSRDQIESCC